MSSFPAIEQILPHRAPMLLLAEVLEHDAKRTVCRVDLARAHLFQAPDGSVAPWIGLELLAQCVAAHAGIRAWLEGKPPKPGLFLGTRRSRFHTQRISADPSLRASVEHLRGEQGLARFEARLYTAEPDRSLVTGVLSVYLFEDLSAMRKRLGHGPTRKESPSEQ